MSFPDARRAALLAAAWLALALAAASESVFRTLALKSVGALPLAGLGSLVGGLAIAVVLGASRRERTESAGAPLFERAVLAAAAALLLLGVPYAVMLNRHTDAPAGSVVIFWTTAFAGLALALCGSMFLRERLVSLAGALLATVGAAGVLANWERPSSFSLFSRYISEQVVMLLAALVAALLVTFIVSRIRRHGLPHVVWPIALGSTLAGVCALGLARTPLSALLATSPLVTALSAGMVTVLVLAVGARYGLAVAGAALAFAPVLISALTILEAATGMLGPRPLLAAAVLASSAVVVAGAATVLADARSGQTAPSRAPAGAASPEPVSASGVRTVVLRRPAWALAAVAFLLALIGLATPGVAVAVKGTLADGGAFDVAFKMSGFETVGGWLALALAALVAAVARRPSDEMSRPRVIVAGLTLITGLVAWALVKDVPLHTWVAWIPPEVQQDYGTEYAVITFTGTPVYAQVGAALASGLAGTILMWNTLVPHLAVRHDAGSTQGEAV